MRDDLKSFDHRGARLVHARADITGPAFVGAVGLTLLAVGGLIGGAPALGVALVAAIPSWVVLFVAGGWGYDVIFNHEPKVISIKSRGNVEKHNYLDADVSWHADQGTLTVVLPDQNQTYAFQVPPHRHDDMKRLHTSFTRACAIARAEQEPQAPELPEATPSGLGSINTGGGPVAVPTFNENDTPHSDT